MKRILFLSFLIPIFGFSQAPSGYYDGTSGLSGYALKSKLHDIVSKNINWNYDDLKTYCNLTDIDKFYDYNASNTTILLDLYSNNPTGTTAYHYTSENLISSANAEGLGWNREHQMPQSTYNSNYPMYSDLFYIIPADARINQLRSNYPYGEAKTGVNPFYTFTNGSKISPNGTANSAYTGRVYEPRNEFKGDIARSLLYFVMRYEGKLNTFNFFKGTTQANDVCPLDGSEEKAYEDWYVAMLLKWHNQDPVSASEIARNNAVYGLQKNRNPFIDHPEWVNLIWNQTRSVTAPQVPVNLNAQQTSAYFVTLNWNASSDGNVLGYKIYQNGIYVGYTKSNSLSVDHLLPSTPYNFTVKAYSDNYMESAESNLISVTTLDSDVFAKDLMITKFINGTDNNKAYEITNKTGHTINLNNYRLNIQFYSGTNYYSPAPYEMEGTIGHNETFVVLNPRANLSCITNEQAKLVTAAPQMTFNGSNYLELKYLTTTIDAMGTYGANNSATLGNVSLYRLPSVTNPTKNFSISEWQSYPVDYCENLGVLAASDLNISTENNWSIYPNPVIGNTLYVKGKQLEKVQKSTIFDITGKFIQQENVPFKNKNSVNVQNLNSGIYILKLDDQTLKFIKK
ncbi:endonuclease [Kaistella sp.]|uniref:endonuclease n=1 Tax=Kaistella sp. TaxID=2782235 RepID=UPI003C5994AB